MTQQLLVKSTTAAWYMTQSTNKVVYSSKFDESEWVRSNCTVTAGQTDPSAGTNAFTLTATAANATIRQVVGLDASVFNRVFSIYLKRKTGTGTISLTIDGTTYTAKTITASWARYDVTTTLASSATIGVKIATSGDEVYIAFAQLEDGTTPTTYVANGENRYTITQIVDADYPINTVRGCAFMDGFFFVMTPKGEIQQSALENAASWAALDFIQSQNDPGKGVFLSKVQNYIVAFKEWAIEFFYNAGNPTGSVLSPVQNATVQVGCASDGSVQDMAGTIVFMGQTKNGFGRSIFSLNGTSPQKISSPQLDKILDSSNLETVYSWSAQVGSHMLYGVTLVDKEKTLVYDFSTQQWSFFTYLTTSGVVKTVTAITAVGVVTSAGHGLVDSQIVKISGCGNDFNGWHVVTAVTTNTFTIQATGTAFNGSGSCQLYVESYFPIVASVRANGRQYMQDATSGALYEFSQAVYIDNVGAIAARVRTPKLTGETNQLKTISEAELIGDKIDSDAVLRYSDDDYRTYSAARPIDLLANRSRIRRLGNYNRRAFEVIHVKNALFRMEALEVTTQ